MKKFTNENDVVLTMTEQELGILKLLVITGIRKKMRIDFWTEEQKNKFKELYNQMI